VWSKSKKYHASKNYFAAAHFIRQKLSEILKLYPKGTMDETEGGDPVSHGN